MYLGRLYQAHLTHDDRMVFSILYYNRPGDTQTPILD